MQRRNADQDRHDAKPGARATAFAVVLAAILAASGCDGEGPGARAPGADASSAADGADAADSADGAESADAADSADSADSATGSAAAAGRAAAPGAGGFDFAAWVAANAACEGDFVADAQEPDFPARLRAAGVSFNEDDGLGEIGPGASVLTPGRPIQWQGLAVRRVEYSFGSGAVFAVVVQASAEQAQAAVGAGPLAPMYQQASYRLGVATAAPSEDVPMPDIRFVRPGREPGTQEIGCAAFDV